MGLYIVFTPKLLIAQGVLFPVVCTLLVVSRFVSRKQKRIALGLDDYLIIPALILMIGIGVAELIGVCTHSMGYPDPPPPAPGVRPYQELVASQVYWHVQWMQALALGCIKLSFIFFYRRIFAVNFKSGMHLLNVASIVLGTLVVVWSIGFFFSYIFICPGHPTAYWFSSALRIRYCWNTTKFISAYVWSDPAIDVFIFLLPIPSILRLHMTTNRKLAVIAIFFLGALAIAASFIRASFYVEILKVSRGTKYDPIAVNTSGTYWSILETGLALIAVNLPVLYGWIKVEGIDSMVRSVRSLQSLHSRRSRGAGGSGSDLSRSTKVSRNGSADPTVHLESHGVSSEIYATPSSGSQIDTVEDGKIKVITEVRIDEQQKEGR